MNYIIEDVSDETKHEMVAYLMQNEERSLFLLGNFATYGFKMTNAPYSGNFKLIRRDNRIVGAFCLSKQGTLIIQSDVGEVVFDDIVQECLSEKLKGLIGGWEVTEPLWEYLKAKSLIQHVTYASKEVLYSLELAQVPPQKQSSVRYLQDTDYQAWLPLRLAYMKELGFQPQLTREEMHEHFVYKTKQKIAWGLFQKDTLVSIADLNAMAFDLGQLGGVYTLPSYRSRGFAKSLVQHVLYDAKFVHHIRKLIIFTSEKNKAAQCVYESLNAQKIGHYGLFFG